MLPTVAPPPPPQPAQAPGLHYGGATLVRPPQSQPGSYPTFLGTFPGSVPPPPPGHLPPLPPGYIMPNSVPQQAPFHAGESRRPDAQAEHEEYDTEEHEEEETDMEASSRTGKKEEHLGAQEEVDPELAAMYAENARRYAAWQQQCAWMQHQAAVAAHQAWEREQHLQHQAALYARKKAEEFKEGFGPVVLKGKWLWCIPLRPAGFVCALCTFLFSIIQTFGLITPTFGVIIGGLDDVSRVISGVLGAVGVIGGIAGLAGCFDMETRYIGYYWYFSVFQTIMFCVIAANDTRCLSYCEAWTHPFQNQVQYNEMMQGVADSRRCDRIRLWYDIFFTIKLVIAVTGCWIGYRLLTAMEAYDVATKPKERLALKGFGAWNKIAGGKAMSKKFGEKPKGPEGAPLAGEGQAKGYGT